MTGRRQANNEVNNERGRGLTKRKTDQEGATKR